MIPKRLLVRQYTTTNNQNMAGKALSALAATLSLCAANACGDHHCWGVNICTGDGVCGPPSDCDASSITVVDDVIQIRGSRCRVTMEAIHLALPDDVLKDGTEYTLNKKLVVRDGCILEIHGASKASSPDAVVTLLRLKVRGLRLHTTNGIKSARLVEPGRTCVSQSEQVICNAPTGVLGVATCPHALLLQHE